MKTKTATILFGMVTVAAASTASANPGPQQHGSRTLDAAIHRLLRAPLAIQVIQRPRVDASGDVACGNVMNKSAPGHVCSVAAPIAAPAPIAIPAAQPLLDADGDVLCGNVKGKGKQTMTVCK